VCRSKHHQDQNIRVIALEGNASQPVIGSAEDIANNAKPCSHSTLQRFVMPATLHACNAAIHIKGHISTEPGFDIILPAAAAAAAAAADGFTRSLTPTVDLTCFQQLCSGNSIRGRRRSNDVSDAAVQSSNTDECLCCTTHRWHGCTTLLHHLLFQQHHAMHPSLKCHDAPERSCVMPMPICAQRETNCHVYLACHPSSRTRKPLQ